MKVLFSLLLCGVSFLVFSQSRGEVFPERDPVPMQSRFRHGSISVVRSLYRIRFVDDAIPEIYKKAVEEFFTNTRTGKNLPAAGKFTLKVELHDRYIWIEGERTIKAP
ncbi:hypothetical protein EDM00_11625 [Ornithobacterium rhinotracheale]|uniref:hypothetical protein n=1 Tax=Ornithobacterium rhinotracheale TaxID=28251 RepID=UPI00129CA131|nr:hypothetical protein [Ornithobacterium rhinotracheale]MRI64629.1 hypothetical protein [Ornithobacterium rhinotracheale]